MPDHYAFLKGRRIQQDGSSDRDKRRRSRHDTTYVGFSFFAVYLCEKSLIVSHSQAGCSGDKGYMRYFLCMFLQPFQRTVYKNGTSQRKNVFVEYHMVIMHGFSI